VALSACPCGRQARLRSLRPTPRAVCSSEPAEAADDGVVAANEGQAAERSPHCHEKAAKMPRLYTIAFGRFGIGAGRALRLSVTSTVKDDERPAYAFHLGSRDRRGTWSSRRSETRSGTSRPKAVNSWGEIAAMLCARHTAKYSSSTGTDEMECAGHNGFLFGQGIRIFASGDRDSFDALGNQAMPARSQCSRRVS